MSASIYFKMNFFCFSHLKVAIFAFRFLKNVSQIFFKSSDSKVTPNLLFKVTNFWALLNTPPMYSQTKQYIKNLRYIVIVTHVRSNHANFQRFWSKDKGPESFEIRPPTHHSKFPAYKPITQRDLPKLEKYYTLEFRLWVSVNYLCFLCIFTKIRGSPLYYNDFN